MKAGKSFKKIIISLTITLITCFLSQNSLAENSKFTQCSLAKIYRMTYSIDNTDYILLINFKLESDERKVFYAFLRTKDKDFVARIEKAFYMNYGINVHVKESQAACRNDNFAATKAYTLDGFEVSHPVMKNQVYADPSAP